MPDSVAALLIQRDSPLETSNELGLEVPGVREYRIVITERMQL
jgi:hypothetical protein